MIPVALSMIASIGIGLLSEVSVIAAIGCAVVATTVAQSSVDESDRFDSRVMNVRSLIGSLVPMLGFLISFVHALLLYRQCGVSPMMIGVRESIAVYIGTSSFISMSFRGTWPPKIAPRKIPLFVTGWIFVVLIGVYAMPKHGLLNPAEVCGVGDGNLWKYIAVFTALVGNGEILFSVCLFALAGFVCAAINAVRGGDV